jgi:hypothetical protein
LPRALRLLILADAARMPGFVLKGSQGQPIGE